MIPISKEEALKIKNRYLDQPSPYVPMIKNGLRKDGWYKDNFNRGYYPSNYRKAYLVGPGWKLLCLVYKD